MFYFVRQLDEQSDQFELFLGPSLDDCDAKWEKYGAKNMYVLEHSQT